MKTLFKLFASTLLLSSVFIYGCSKEPDSIDEPEKAASPSYDLDAYLNIDSPDMLENLILTEEGHKTRAQYIANAPGFVSMTECVVNVNPDILASIPNCEFVYGPKDQIRFYDILDYDVLVPNENFAKLLNAKGEIKIDNTLYRVTEAGTFYCDPGKQQYLEDNLANFMSIGTTGQNAGEDTYEVAPGVYLIDTFKQLAEEEEDDTSFYYPELDDYDIDDDPATRTLYNPWNRNDFPTFKSSAKTVAGKILAKLGFGDNSWKRVKFSSKRRLSGKLYDYKYGPYSEQGASAKMQKKNWFGWSKTKADELVLGWIGVKMVLDLKIPKNAPGFPTGAWYAGTKEEKMPGTGKSGIIATIFGVDTDNSLFKQALKQGDKAIVRYIKSKINNATSWQDQRIDAIVIANRGKVEFIVVDELRTANNTKSMTHVFGKDFRFIVSIDLFNLPKSVADYGKMLTDLGKAPIKDITDGRVVVAGRLSDKWMGMYIVKK